MLVRRISLRAKLALIICCISFFSIVVSSLAFFFSVKKINEDIVYNNLESLQLAVEDNISSSLSAIDKTAKNIILGSNVRQFLREGANLAEMDESGKVLLRQSIEREISNQMLFNSILEEGLIESVNFYLDEHNIAFFFPERKPGSQGLSLCPAGVPHHTAKIQRKPADFFFYSQ